MKINKNSLGYTIIELLAVVSILVIISGVITGILFSTLRGSNKSKITTEVSQNGSFALSAISNLIINSVDITAIDGISIPDCTANPSGTSITLKKSNGGSTTFSCGDIDGVYTIASDGASLINTDIVQIAADSCTFSCSNPDSYTNPIVYINFNITDKNAAASESRASDTFNTSVSIRNFSP